MNPDISILTNMAFNESRIWRDNVVTICRTGETPDNLPPLRQAFRLLKKRHCFDAVVTMGPRTSLAYGLICALLRRPSRQILTEVFLDEARPDSLKWRFKTAVFKYVARRSLGILTNSSAEVEFMSRRFEIPECKLRFVPMYTTMQRPAREPLSAGYILSTGRSGRDWEILLRAAPQFVAPLHIIAGAADRLPSPLPDRVQVFREIPLEQAHAAMQKAAIVVLPLLPAERSTGQVVLFEALAMGKPVVATRVTGIIDYIRDGINGLLVDPGNATALAQKVNQLLQDPALAFRLSAAALNDCQQEWNAETHATRKIEAIRTLIEQAKESA